MARSIDKIVFGLKLRTHSVDNSLTLRVGNKKYALPFEARIIQSDEYLFVHLPPASSIMKFGGDGLEVVNKADDAEKAVKSFRKARKARTAKRVEVPDALKDALNAIPAGYKLGYDAEGNMKLVKMRVRRKPKAAKPTAAKAKKTTARKKTKKA